MAPAPKTLVLVLTLLVSGLVAGCTSGGPSYVKTKFQDADQRVAQSADGGYSEYWDIVVPRGTPALTVRSAFLADQGISFALRNPSGRLTTSFQYPGSTEVPEMTWIEMRRPLPGTWRMGIDCTRRCDFSFGFYLKDAVPKLEDVSRAFTDATARFTEDTEAGATRANEFRVPANASRLELRYSLHSNDGFQFRLEDSVGQRRAATSFPASASVLEARYLVMQDPTPGTWRLNAECRHGCSYAIGVYVA